MLALTLPAVASAREVYQRVVPPPYVVDGLSKVAIIEGDDGRTRHFGNTVAATLRTRIGYDQGLPEADPGLHSDVLDFASVSGPAVPGIEEVVRIGASVGAQVVLAASVDGQETEYESFSLERTRQVKQSDGTYVSQKYTVPCGRRAVQASGTWTLYSAANGTVITKESFRQGAVDTDCDEGERDDLSLRSASDMINGLIGHEAMGAAAKFAPRWDRIAFKFVREQSTRDVTGAAEDGDWITAVEGSQTTLSDDPFNAAAIYHIGLALELGGRPADAAGLYGFAKRMKDLDVYADSLTRARKRAIELQQLKGYGLEVKPTSYAGVDALVARASAAAQVAVVGTAGVMKGTKNKRLPIFSDESGTGDVLSMVPGGTDVRIIKAGATLTQIQLPDGGQGWVSSKEVK